MAKTRKVEEEESLLPGLPDHVAQLCLRRLKPCLLYSVCPSWRRLLYSPSFPPHLSLYALTMSLHSRHVQFFNFDPLSSTWRVLPDPPLRLLLRHPSFISRTLPIQSVSVSDRLVLLAATTNNLSPAIPSPLVFDPTTKAWRSGPEMVHKRRWCAAGACQGAVYVASGIGAHYSPGLARSAERWAGGSGSWEKIGGLKDGRFSREAIEAVGWRGKLCMVNVKGRAAKEGAVYDVARDEWEEMPLGMIAGWRGPVAAMDEAHMYVVDEDEGVLRRFHPEREEWETVVESESLRGAEQMAARGGRLCVVVGRGERIVVVDVVAEPARVWVVDTPPGWQALALHILPRMNQTTFTSSSTSTSH